MEKTRYMISDAANIVNVESHVLRYWEEELELQIPRNEMGHRYYTEENIMQFQKIKEWKEKGYQLKAIRMMIHNGEYVMEKECGREEETSICSLQHSVPSNLQQGMQQPVISNGKNNNSALNAVKLEQFQNMMMGIVKQAVEENNQALGKEVGLQVGDRILKEINYLMREQDEAEEERFRKLDAAIRNHQKGRRFRKEKSEKKLLTKKKLNPNLTT